MVYRTRILILAAALAAPGFVLASWFIVTSTLSPLEQGIDLVAFALAWVLLLGGLARVIDDPVSGLANLVGALRRGDFSQASARKDERGSFGLLARELSALAIELKENRLGQVESRLLLRQLVEGLDVVLVAFDEAGRATFWNRAAESLWAGMNVTLTGATPEQLGLKDSLSGATPRLVDLAVGARASRFELRRGHFREEGRAQHLLFLSDVTRALRDEERQAWTRLIQVLRHEINNSLAPIHSLAGSLVTLLESRTPGWEADVREGLGIVARRSESLNRFLAAYARLTRLPPPVLLPIDVDSLIRGVVLLETRRAIHINPGPATTVSADRGQLEQVLINLLGNAVEAAAETDGQVVIGWQRANDVLEIEVADTGPGLLQASSLFVPFFTTKREGTGIGLVLARMIIEAHGGSVALASRLDCRGATAIVRLPRALPKQEG